MREFTQEGMFNELSKITRAVNKKKFEKMDLPKFTYGGPDEPTTTPVDEDINFYTKMANSPLFVERYARMVGKPLEEVKDEAEAYRQQILNNIKTVKINDVGVFPKGVRRSDTEFIDGVYYAPLKKEDIDKAYQHANDLPKLFRKGFLRRINKEIQNYPDHQLFLYQDDPWVKTHELSHGSVKGQMENMNVNEYNFKDMSDELPKTRRYYEGREEYLTDPNEQKARVDVARKYLESKGLYDPVNEPFTEKHYKHLNNELIKNFFKVGKNQGFESDADPNLPLDIEEIINPYDEKTVIKMFNDFVSNDSKKDLTQARLGGLAKFITGGSNNCPQGLVWDEKLQDCVKPNKQMEEVLITPVTMHIARYEDQNPYADFFAKKKAEYIKRAGNFGKITNLEVNFPDAQIKKIKDEYEYNRNNYVANKLGYDYEDREKWIDKLSPAARAVLQNSEYASKLQPSLWAKTNAGLRALGNTLLPGQPISYNVKGLSPKEEAEYKKDKFAAFDAVAFADLPGAVVFNALADSRPYAKNPGVLSGEVVNEAGEMGAGLLNPLVPIEMATGVSFAPDLIELGLKGAQGAYRTGKNAVQTISNLGPVQTATDKITSAAQRLNLPEVANIVKGAVMPGGLKKVDKELKGVAEDVQANLNQNSELTKRKIDITMQAQDIEWKLRSLTSNVNTSRENGTQIVKLKKELDKLYDAQKEIDLKLEGDKLKFKDLDTYEKLGTMKTTLGDGANELIDFETGEKIPIQITTPSITKEVGLQEGTPYKTVVDKDNDYGFNQAYADTQNKNIEFVKGVMPGAKPYGSSVLHNIGVAHASNDIDVAITASDWEKVKDKVSVNTSKQSKFGPTVNLGEQYGAQGNIDVNIIGENAKTGMAEGDFAKELYRQFFPDEFYKQTQSIIEKNLGKNTRDLGNVTINKTAKELIDAYDPEIKSILDAYEITPVSRNSVAPTKNKHINRIDYILENATDYDKVAKAQELFAKSIAGGKASIGQQFSTEQLSDVAANLNMLNKMGLVGSNHNSLKIALDPKKMQLFLNDFYINKSIYTRQVVIDPKHIKNSEDLISAYKDWRSLGGSNMGMGTNSVELGSPRFHNADADVTGNIYYNLSKGKVHASPTEYIDDILSQTSGNRKLTDNEKIVISDLAKSYNIPIKEGYEPSTLGDLLDESRYMKSDEAGTTIGNLRLSKSLPNDFVSNVNSFYKEAAKVLGAKTIQRGIFNNQQYATLLNDFDEQFDAITLAFNKDVPYVKSRYDRIENLKGVNTKRKVEIDAKDYYKFKYYLEGGSEVVESKLKEAEEFKVAFDEQLQKKSLKLTGNSEEYNMIKSQQEELQKEIIKLNELRDKLYDRQRKIKNVRVIGAGVGVLGAIGGIGVGLKKIGDAQRADEAEFALDLIEEKENRTGKLSADEESRRQFLKKFLKDANKENTIMDYNPFRGMFR
jgi:hypothetical protein